MAPTRTGTFDQRGAILTSLATRNRVVALLRIIVPAAGAAAFLLLVLQIYVANTLRQYGVSGIRIDRGALVVDTPQYSGVGSDGARYSASAKEARSPIGQPTTIIMADPVLELARPGSPKIELTAKSAIADTLENVVTIPGTATLHSDDGMRGTLNQLRTELRTGVTVASGAVELSFANGASLNAQNLRYDGKARLWSLDQVTFIFPGLPEATR